MKKKVLSIVLSLAMVFSMVIPAFASEYTVVKGDSLWKIASTQLGSGARWKDIYEANKATVKDPNLIYVGQKLEIPDGTATTPEVKPTPAPVPAGTFVPGTYTGESNGFGGKITATVTFSAERIESIVVTGPNETAGIGSVAVEKLPAKMVEVQSTQVDAMSGATVSSKGIIAAVNAAIVAAGADPAALTPASAGAETDTPDTLDADVVIVGAGGAGMTAAITAAQAGKKVVLLEKTAMTGGNTSKSTGGMNAADTNWQDNYEFKQAAGLEKTLSTAAVTYPQLADLVATVQKQYDEWQAAGSKGYFDTVELMILDTMVGGKCVNDLDLVTVLAKNSAAAVDWIDTIGGDLHNVGAFGGASVNRIHWPKNDKGQKTNVGAYLVPILEQACKDAGVNIIFEAPASEIVMAGGKAVGVKTSTGLTVNADSVILTSGGFGANLPMVAQLNPNLDGFVTTNAPGCTGDGIQMAQAVGAAVRDMDQIQIHPTVEQKTSALITEGLRGDGAILLNQDGKRFCDEVGTRDAVSAAELAQTGGYAYLIVDQKMVDASATIQGYIKKGFTVQGDTYEALGEAMGAPGAAVAESMNNWNKYLADGKDPEFDRTSFASALDTAPYYAIKIAPGIHHTMGGVVINTSAQVLDTNNKPIAGLFAAGEVTGGIHGANRLGGNAVADIIVFGRIAGQGAANGVSTAAAYTDGTYTGSAYGMNGDVPVTVVVKGGKIDSVTVGENKETPGIGDKAVAAVPGAIVAAQSANVDAVAGATITSNAIMAAVKNALEGEKDTAAVDVSSADVIVVGAGMSGLVSAYQAANLGASVILFEQSGAVGGSSRFAGATLAGACTKLQAAAGIEDSFELAYEDLGRLGGFENLNRNLAWMHVQRAGEMVDWAVDELGLEFGEPYHGGYTPTNVARVYNVTGGGKTYSNTVYEKLTKYIDAGQVTLLLNTEVTELVTDNGVVTGVKDANGKSYTSQGVIMASGGYAYNRELVEQYNFAHSRSQAPTTNIGSGYGIVKAVGGTFSGMEYLPAYAGAVDTSEDTYTLTLTADTSGWSGSIWVDMEGKRHSDEVDFTTFSRQKTWEDSKENYVYIIFTEEMKETAETPILSVDAKAGNWDRFDTELAEGYCVFAADSIEELAKKANIDAAGLAATVKTYNKDAKNGKDTEFGRTKQLMPIEGTKYYAIRTVPYILLTKGGVNINTSAQILREDGSPIEGLYAAGEFIGGANLGGFSSHGGLAHSMNFVWGTIAAENAVSRVQGKEVHVATYKGVSDQLPQ